MALPLLNEQQQFRETTQVFGGINRNPKVDEGEFYRETNMSARKFPCMAPRLPRSNAYPATGVQAVHVIGGRDVWVRDNKLYIDQEEVPGIALPTGAQGRQIINFGAYAIVLPDMVYCNVEKPSDRGNMAATYESTGQISYTMSRDDGTDYDTTQVHVGDTPPANPANGQYWIDTSADNHMLMLFSSYSDAWTQIPSVYTKISAAGIGAQFSEYDGVTISGAAYTGSNANVQTQIEALNGGKTIYAAGQDYILVTGLLDAVYTQTTGRVKVERKIPRMQHMCVSQNRLWGCFFGEVDGATVNEIYASRLGDFKNFYSFMGISTDSYAVTVGQGGVFTGAASHLGYPIFFKENCLYKVFGNQPRNFQVNDTLCAGVQEGSERSLAIVNHTLYYLSRDGEVVSYNGALPVSVSGNLGGMKLSGGVAGALGDVYYLCAYQDGAADKRIMTLDTRRMIWHEEDTAQVTQFAPAGINMHMLDGGGLKYVYEPSSGIAHDPVEWMAETGLIGWMQPDQKYISRFNIRAEMASGSSVKLQIEYNSSGNWTDHGEKVASNAAVGTVMLPVRPRRCDHFRLRISGVGDVTIYSVDKILEVGGDGYAHI